MSPAWTVTVALCRPRKVGRRVVAVVVVGGGAAVTGGKGASILGANPPVMLTVEGRNTPVRFLAEHFFRLIFFFLPYHFHVKLGICC